MAKVFISCGQKKDKKEEISTAQKVKKWLEKEGYTVYVAVNEQNLQDLDSAIVNNLVDSDYYLFIDFKREKIPEISDKDNHRGALFAHQELALAYYLSFENSIFLRQEGVISEGFLKSIQGNSISFGGYNEVLKKVKEQIRERWDKNYSRRLVAGDITEQKDLCQYSDHLGKSNQYIWNCRIDNKRKREAAQNVEARLKEIRDENGNVKSSPDKQALKWAGAYKSYSYVIPPQSDGTFDLFYTLPGKLTEIYLHSLLDFKQKGKPREPIIREAGEFHLVYQISSINFPPLKFCVKLNSRKIPLEVNIVKSSDRSEISFIM